MRSGAGSTRDRMGVSEMRPMVSVNRRVAGSSPELRPGCRRERPRSPMTRAASRQLERRLSQVLCRHMDLGRHQLVAAACGWARRASIRHDGAAWRHACALRRDCEWRTRKHVFRGHMDVPPAIQSGGARLRSAVPIRCFPESRSEGLVRCYSRGRCRVGRNHAVRLTRSHAKATPVTVPPTEPASVPPARFSAVPALAKGPRAGPSTREALVEALEPGAYNVAAARDGVG